MAKPIVDARHCRQFATYRPYQHWARGRSPCFVWRRDDPPQVADELRSANRPEAVRELIAGKPSWLTIQEPKVNPPISPLHAGEAAAINLVTELKADLLLIDDMAGRKAAAQRNIRLMGTIGVLELAATAKLLDLKDAFEKIKQTDFWILPSLLGERLKRFSRS